MAPAVPAVREEPATDACGPPIFHQALVREAQVDLSLNQVWVQRQNFLEFFRREDELALSERCLARAKGDFDLRMTLAVANRGASTTGQEEKGRRCCPASGLSSFRAENDSERIVRGPP